MEALFARDTGKLFGCDSTAPRSFYCPTTPQRLTSTNKASSVLASSNQKSSPNKQPPPPPSPRQWPMDLPSSDLLWELRTPWNSRQSSSLPWNGGQSSSLTPSTSHSESPSYNESWPSCSEKTPPTARSHAPPTSTVQNKSSRPPLEEDLKRETGPRPSLASLVERFRKAPPTRREERGKEPSWECVKLTPPTGHSTPGSDGSCRSVAQNTSASHQSGAESFVNPSPQVSDESLEGRSQGLIDRGSSLVSSPSSSSTASSLATKNYFNSNRQSSGTSKEKVGLINPPLSQLRPDEDILYQWRLRRRLEEARREARLVGEQAKQFHPQPANKRDPSLSPLQPQWLLASGSHPTGSEVHTKTGLTDMGTRVSGIGNRLTSMGNRLSGIGIGLGVDRRNGEVTLVGCTPQVAEIDKHKDRGNCFNGGSAKLSDLGAVEDDSNELPSGPPTKKDSVAQTDPTEALCDEPTSKAKGESVCPVRTRTPPSLSGLEAEASRAAAVQYGSASSLSEAGKGPRTTLNQDLIIPSKGAVEKPGTVINHCGVPPPSNLSEVPTASTPSLEPEEDVKDSRLTPELTASGLEDQSTLQQTPSMSLEQGNQGGGSVATGESSHWTITPSGSPDSRRGRSIGPLLDQVVATRLFQHGLSSPPTLSKTPPPRTPPQPGLLDVETHHPLPVSPCGHHWEDDMEDDLLKLLIDKARCFEATIRKIDLLLLELQSTDS